MLLHQKKEPAGQKRCLLPVRAQGTSADCRLSRGRQQPQRRPRSCYWQLFSYHQREFIAPLTDAEIQEPELKAKGIESENKNANKKKTGRALPKEVA